MVAGTGDSPVGERRVRVSVGAAVAAAASEEHVEKRRLTSLTPGTGYAVRAAWFPT